MLNEKDLYEIDTIDAMLFSGDSLICRDNYLSFKKTMDRWNNRMIELDKISLETSAREAEEYEEDQEYKKSLKNNDFN